MGNFAGMIPTGEEHREESTGFLAGIGANRRECLHILKLADPTADESLPLWARYRSGFEVQILSMDDHRRITHAARAMLKLGGAEYEVRFATLAFKEYCGLSAERT